MKQQQLHEGGGSVNGLSPSVNAARQLKGRLSAHTPRIFSICLFASASLGVAVPHENGVVKADRDKLLPIWTEG